MDYDDTTPIAPHVMRCLAEAAGELCAALATRTDCPAVIENHVRRAEVAIRNFRDSDQRLTSERTFGSLSASGTSGSAHPNTMTREKAIEELKVEQANPDREVAHRNADDVLCNLLIELGYEAVVDEYNKVRKWFA